MPLEHMEKNLRAVVIGGSAGAISPLKELLQELPSDFAAALIIVIHLHASSQGFAQAGTFSSSTLLKIKEAEGNELIRPATVYFAPANYHLLVERDLSFSLSIDPKVRFSRPSIDVLFESAAEAFQDSLVGILLSGGSDDGVNGLRRIQKLGGQILIQAPETAEVPLMVEAATQQLKLDAVLTPGEIGKWLTAAGTQAATRKVK